MKKIIIILIILLVLLQYKIWVGDGGVPRILQLQEEVETVQAKSKQRRRRNGGGSNGITDKDRAFMFYCMWRLRKEENPSFEYLNKDTTLMICYFIVKEQVDEIMSQL